MSPGPLSKVVVTWSGLKGPISQRFEQDVGLRGIELFIGDDRDEILRQLPDAEVTFVAPFDAEMLSAAKQLRWVHAHVGGVESYLFPEMVASPIPFTCIKSTFATVGREFAIAAMLLFARRLNHVIGTEALSVEVESRDHELHPEDLAGKTVGVLGLGNMGRAIARGAGSMGMHVLALARTPRPAPEQVDHLYTVEDIDHFLAQCDYVVIALPVTGQTRGWINQALLRKMKTSAYLIDCSGRLALYDFGALVRAIEEDWIAGVCLQPTGPVGSPDIPPAASSFWQRPNVVVSPCRGTSVEQDEVCLKLFFDNLNRYRSGQPLRDLVDKQAGY